MVKTKKCTRCKKSLPLDSFYRNSRQKMGLSSCCKECQDWYNQRRLNTDPQYRLWWSSRIRANQGGIAHTIRPKDIPLPKTCIYLGIPLDYRCAADRRSCHPLDCPSIDRIDPLLGYTANNVQVISYLANRMKSNATREQLITFAQNVLKIHSY